MSYDLASMRKALAEKNKGQRDPFEFVPPKAKSGQVLNYRFFILPPLKKGDKTHDGVASRDMDLYYVQNGAHWIAKKPHSCPRVHDDADCAMCNYGFDLMGEVTGTGDAAKKAKSLIAKNWLPQQKYAVNIFFPNDPVNPEELRGKVMWWNAPKTFSDIAEACLMSDSAGDENKPQAFGIFFDENAAYLFNLEIHEKSNFNNYEKSQFLPLAGKRPIVGKKDENGVIQPVPAGIQKVLGLRHDLYTKFGVPDAGKIEQILRSLVDRKATPGGTAAVVDAGFSEDESRVIGEEVGGETGAPVAAPATPPKTMPKAATPAPAKAPAVKPKAAPVAATPVATAAAPATTGDDDADLAALMSQLEGE